MTTPPKAILSVRTFSRMSGEDEKVHENWEEHKTEIPLGQNSAVQNGTNKNQRVVHGGASRDRTDDLIVAKAGSDSVTRYKTIIYHF
jgi:hypothetical protein